MREGGSWREGGREGGYVRVDSTDDLPAPRQFLVQPPQVTKLNFFRHFMREFLAAEVSDRGGVGRHGDGGLI